MWEDILRKGDFEYEPDKGRLGIFRRKDKDVKMNLPSWGKKLKHPGYEFLDEEGNIKPVKHMDFIRQMASSLGHEFIHYATVDEFQPEQEKTTLELIKLIEAPSLNEGEARRLIEKLVSIAYWIELVANTHDMNKMSVFLNTTWNSLYLRRVRNGVMNSTINEITDGRANIFPVNSTDFKLEMLDTYIDDEVYAGDRVKEELIALYNIFNDVMFEKALELQKKSKKFWGV